MGKLEKQIFFFLVTHTFSLLYPYGHTHSAVRSLAGSGLVWFFQLEEQNNAPNRLASARMILVLSAGRTK
jgi:hypothetical protein